ncbi:hypothetical protein SVIO_020790 [Streptomyces violaceusniger]|uniref:Uncharacterized protein n=1 Tax=Streptomyces violaceusniger TaxID=68280 RepID=A0A4D4KX64_STRVO|nr:hypothetical protein SVIO_020790 [Streptomyces violaceusniger]
MVSAGVARDIMPPCPARWWAMVWLRRVMILAAVGRVRCPATWAAAISPWEWPMTASGWMPTDCQRAARETTTAKVAGWTTSTRSSEGASGAPVMTSMRDQSV